MAAPKLSERRVSQRYILGKESLCGHVVLEKTIVLPIIDISYGGFSTTLDTPEHQSLSQSLPRTSEVEIMVLGVSTTGRAIRVFETKQRLGYAFCHDTASVLIFLRRFIEFMRLGEHMRIINKSMLKPPYDSGEWLCFRGDGPTDVVLKKSGPSSTTIDEAIITYREKESYRTAEFRDGRITTLIRTDSSGGNTSSRSGNDTLMNDDILRKTTCILMGHVQSCDAAERPYIESALKIFRKQILSGSSMKPEASAIRIKV